MKNNVSNTEYEKALTNIDNKITMDKACARFRGSLDIDELHRCKLIALWNALQTWRTGGQKFTSFLYHRVRWECIKAVKQGKNTVKIDVKNRSVSPNPVVRDLMNELPPDLKDVVEKRYFYNMTLREIGEEYNYSYETARRNINRALKHMKTSLLS